MKPIQLVNINSEIPKTDIFISAVSFEKRCFSFIESIDRSSLGEVWFTFNDNEKEFYEENLEKAKNFSNSSLVSFSTDDPLVTGRALLNKFKEINGKKSLLIDVSTFTHEGLLILLKFVFLFKELFKEIFVTYVGAKNYSINESSDEEKWLSKGTKTIRSVLGYPGILNPSQKNHLIILFGFESERTSKLIEDFEFDKVSIGIGPEHDSIGANHYAINRQRHIDLISNYPIAEAFNFSLVDPYETEKQINEQIIKYEGHNIVITPLNNKLSTVGAALVALKNPRVQICYVRAHEYNYKGYSEPADDCYFYKLTL